MDKRRQDTRDAHRGAPGAAPKRPYAAPQLTVHGSVETVTQRGRGRGHDKPKKHTKHPHQQP